MFQQRSGQNRNQFQLINMEVHMTASRWFLLSIALSASTACSKRDAETPQLAALPQCSEAQLLGHVPDSKQIKAHRQTPIPAVKHAFGTKKEWWGMDLTLRVDEDGRTVCYSATKMPNDEKLTLDAPTRTELAKVRYRPFLRGGKPTAAIVAEELREEELLEKQVPTPQVPLEQVSITLERTGCYGTCPSYTVEMRGDGQVTYTGKRFVDVEGAHTYRVPAADVVKLVDSLRAKNLWSMRTSYRAGITDNPTYALTLKLGDQVHCIEDYVGESAGMPAVVTEFEDEVDAVSQARSWTELTSVAIARLEAEKFDFTSAEAGAMLARALSGDSRDDAAIARLIELGAPLDQTVVLGFLRSGPSIVTALENQRLAAIGPLVARGALKTNGRVDPAKLDEAFAAAVRGGRLEAVQRIWDAADGQPYPSLVANVPQRPDEKPLRVPVVLLLQRYPKDRPWDGLAIAQWLATKGVDLKARVPEQRTLLHIAVNADDAAFVRYLLDQGLDPSVPGPSDLPPLDSASNEDIAMMLLEAGGRTSDPKHLVKYARERHWGRVVGWLEGRRG